jgi:hypothetical protein
MVSLHGLVIVYVQCSVKHRENGAEFGIWLM